MLFFKNRRIQKSGELEVMNILKFYLKLSVYGLILFCLSVFVNYVFSYLDKRDLDYIDKFFNVPEDIEICNFGASHSQFSFNYESIQNEKTCFNFALSSQLLLYDEKILNCYEEKLKPGGTVFFVVSYPVVFAEDLTKLETFLPSNYRYYRFLKKEEIIAYDIKTDIKQRCFRYFAVGGDIWKLFFDNVNRNDEFWQSTAEMNCDIEEDARKAYLRHLVIGRLDDEGNLVVHQDSVDALYRMIVLCQKKGMDTYLVTPPFLEEYMDQCLQSKDVNEKFYGVMEGIVEKTGVQYLDYSLDERFRKDHSLFLNSDHLNKAGAKKFTDIVLRDVGLLPEED